MERQGPLVSVVIPTYDRASLVTEALLRRLQALKHRTARRLNAS